MVQRVRAILQSARPELLLDSSYFVPWLLPGKARLFTPGTLHRASCGRCRKALRGQAGNFDQRQPLSTGAARAVQRAVRMSGRLCLYSCLFLFSAGAEVLFLLPYGVFAGVFVCVAVHLPELLPPQLLYKIEAAEKATPLPLFAEMLLVILILEIIREAGLRMPQSLGHSVSLVSALIIGDAAIATGLMSTPVIFCGQHHGHLRSFVTPGSIRACHPAAHRHGAVGRACRAGGTSRSIFRLFCSASSAPKHWACPILHRTRSRSSRFPRTAFCAATTDSCPGTGSISGKNGRGGESSHETAHRTFYPGGADAQRGHSSAGRRHPAERPGASGAVAGRSQHGVPVYPFGAGSSGAAG